MSPSFTLSYLGGGDCIMASTYKKRGGPPMKRLTGYRPVLHAREGFMLGIRNPLDGPVFQTYQDALGWCMDVMVSHYERGLGMSEAKIEWFDGLVTA
jgi:hypothetical protein